MPPLTIVNASFETTIHGEDDFSQGVSGWTVNGDVGDWNPTNASLDETTLDDTNVAYIYEDGDTLSQTLTETYDANKTYDFTFLLGDAYEGASDYTVNIYAGSTVIGTVSGTAPDNNELFGASVSSSGFPPDPGLNGQAITIEFVKDSGGLLVVDNVQGTVVCYAPGTMIDTPDGPRPVETLAEGDLVLTRDNGPKPILWTRSGTHPLEELEEDDMPVLIKARALGHNLPTQDLIVSPQHRILVGASGQMEALFASEALAPAKSLTALPGIRHMKGKKDITWIHFACDRHEVVTANGCLSESLLLGPMVVSELNAIERRTVTGIFGPAPSADGALNGPPARNCLTVGAVRRRITKHWKETGRFEAREFRQWDRDLTMEKYAVERMGEAKELAPTSETATRAV